MPNIHQTVRVSILRKRREKGFSQLELANRINTSQAFINQIETGKRHVNLETLNKIAIALECELHDLIPQSPVLQREDNNG